MSLTIDYSLGKFELGKNVIILGPRARGKTDLVLTNIFLNFQSKINHLFVVSKDEKYKEITNHIFNENQLTTIFQEIQSLSRFEQKLLIIDEITIHNNPIIECILINSHHFNITVVIVSQIGELSLVSRDYIDNLVIANEKSVTLVRNIFEKYSTTYGDFINFMEVVSGLGKNEFLFIPKRKNNIGLIRVNNHLQRYLYSYKMFVRYDILLRINGNNKQEYEEILKKVNNMIDELGEIKKRIANK